MDVQEPLRVTIGASEYAVRANLRACVTYAEEFACKVGEPYGGRMADDLITLYTLCEQVKFDRDEDGNPVAVENDEYEGVEANVVPMLRVVWACARGAGSTKLGWEAFLEECMEAEFSAAALGNVYDVVTNGLGNGVIFRIPEGRGGAEVADEGQRA